MDSRWDVDNMDWQDSVRHLSLFSSILPKDFACRCIVNVMSRLQKEIYCFFHKGGKIVSNEGRIEYGGRANGTMVREGMSLLELRRTISSCLDVQCEGFQLKCTLLELDQNTVIDIKDDERVQHLVQFNNKCARLYIVEDVSEFIDEGQPMMISQRLENLEGSDALAIVGSSSGRISQDKPYLIQSVPAPSLSMVLKSGRTCFVVLLRASKMLLNSDAT